MESIEEIQFDSAVSAAERIDKYAAEKNLRVEIVPVLDKRVLIITPEGLDVPDEKMRMYASEHAEAARLGITNNCYEIAKTALERGMGKGVLRGDGTSEFIGWENHYVNYDVLEDGTTAAIDLTASHNIDNRQGEFDVMVCVSPSETQLETEMTGLYGGSWSIRS